MGVRARETSWWLTAEGLYLSLGTEAPPGAGGGHLDLQFNVQ